MAERAFPDKKKSRADFRAITDHIKNAQALNHEMSVSQESATWLANGEYPNLPIMFLWMTDLHYGSNWVNYELLEEHFQIVKETPNTFVLIGGELVDNFSAVKHPQAAIMGDSVSPQVQTRAMLQKIFELDRLGKIGGVTFGTHEDWIQYAGYDYYQTFLQELEAPVLDKGGVLFTIVNGGQAYQIAMTHNFWGKSRINPENAGRRMLEFGFPGSDIALYGHDHQAAGSMFDRGGEDKIVVDGGTYKLKDPVGGKWGLGKAGVPGYTIMLWPNEKRMELFRDPAIAQQVMAGMIFEEERRVKKEKRQAKREAKKQSGNGK